MTQAGNKRGSAPVPVWSAANQALSAFTVAVASMHVGFGPGLIDKDQMLGIKAMLVIAPAFACGGDVWAGLFVR